MAVVYFPPHRKIQANGVLCHCRCVASRRIGNGDAAFSTGLEIYRVSPNGCDVNHLQIGRYCLVEEVRSEGNSIDDEDLNIFASLYELVETRELVFSQLVRVAGGELEGWCWEEVVLKRHDNVVSFRARD